MRTVRQTDGPSRQADASGLPRRLRLQAEVLPESLARSWTRPTPVLRPARASTTLDLYTHHQRELDKRVGDLFADFSPTPAEDDDAEVKGDDGADVV